MIADGTTGKESYRAGRYLYVSPPDAAGKMVIDFNKAYNPPCAFTNYATCPLPPKQNRLPFRSEAGEKKYASVDHLSPDGRQRHSEANAVAHSAGWGSSPTRSSSLGRQPPLLDRPAQASSSGLRQRSG